MNSNRFIADLRLAKGLSTLENFDFETAAIVSVPQGDWYIGLRLSMQAEEIRKLMSGFSNWLLANNASSFTLASCPFGTMTVFGIGVGERRSLAARMDMLPERKAFTEPQWLNSAFIYPEITNLLPRESRVLSGVERSKACADFGTNCDSRAYCIDRLIAAHVGLDRRPDTGLATAKPFQMLQGETIPTQISFESINAALAHPSTAVNRWLSKFSHAVSFETELADVERITETGSSIKMTA